MRRCESAVLHKLVPASFGVPPAPTVLWPHRVVCAPPQLPTPRGGHFMLLALPLCQWLLPTWRNLSSSVKPSRIAHTAPVSLFLPLLPHPGRAEPPSPGAPPAGLHRPPACASSSLAVPRHPRVSLGCLSTWTSAGRDGPHRPEGALGKWLLFEAPLVLKLPPT